ncbi:sodium/hydrogen exchanger 9B2-like [Thrips palmi]|uniref:Sodium/hydrogen exchanger 9B2-like n=1 Tax=Thrips palmi TaxID=161013 RepID=A0A6P8Z6F9_THRPL|nr:sodium/hydrogen exchanger 9B2-like [Thrips palmi]
MDRAKVKKKTTIKAAPALGRGRASAANVSLANGKQASCPVVCEGKLGRDKGCAFFSSCLAQLQPSSAARRTPSAIRQGSADIIRWLTPPTPPPEHLHFLPCCPCRSGLEERACTPVWCFSYRYLDWLLAVAVVLVAVWLAMLLTVGPDVVGPGTPLFAVGSVVLVAYAVGWAMYYHLNLPPTLGMLSVALVYRNVPICWDATDHLDHSVIAAVKSLFFTINIVKAGLYFDGAVFRNYGLTIVLTAVLPCVLESLYVSMLVLQLFDVPQLWALTLGFLWGGVSPVLLSLCLVSLANQGYGTKTGILSILLASGTLDNIVIIVIFDMLRESMALSGSEAALVFGRIAMKVIMSVSSGCLLGLVIACLPNRYSKHALLARFALLIMSSTCIHLACSLYKLDTAAYLCTVTTACFMVNCWRAMEWHEDATPLREAFEMLWHFCHPIMTVMIGISCDFSSMKTDTVWKVLVIYFTGLAVRFPVTYIATAFSRKPPKQRLFMAVSYWSKGLLQTALGGLVLEAITEDSDLREVIATSVALVVIVGTYVVALSSKYLGPLLLPRAE